MKQIIKVNISEKMIAEAKRRAGLIPKNKNTFMNHERHVVGFIGEEMFKQVFPSATISTDQEVYDYDFLLYTKKIEVKTKMVKTIPKLQYECSIYTYFNQDPDFYFFCRVLKENNTYPYGWLLGYIDTKTFYKKSTLIPKGQKQSNGLITRTNTWNIFIHNLTPMGKILGNIEKMNRKSKE